MTVSLSVHTAHTTERAVASAEMDFLIRIARRIAGGEDGEAWVASGTGLDWSRLLDLAGGHAMLPLLGRWIERSGTPVPAEAAAELAERTAGARQRSLLLIAELLRVLRVLDLAGVRAVPYKGPLLAAEVYGDPTLRPSVDLDVLVREDEVDAALGALAVAGFRPAAALSPQQRRLLRVGGHAEGVVSSSGLAVEVHWRIAQRAFIPRLRHEQLWTRLRSARLAGHPVPGLAVEDQFIALSVHGAKHLWLRLEWVTTLSVMLRREHVDWDLVVARAAEWGLLRIVLLSASLANTLLGTPLPPALREPLRTDSVLGRRASRVADDLRSGVPHTLGRSLRFQLANRDSIRDTLRLLAATLAHLSPEDVAAVDLPPSLTPMYHLLRPLRLLTRAAGFPAGRP